MATSEGRAEWLPTAIEEAMAALDANKTVLVHGMRSVHQTGAFCVALLAQLT